MRSEVQREYGGALWAIAVEDNCTETMLEDVRALQTLMRENPGYLRLIRCPDVPLRTRLGLLDEAFRGRVPDTLLHFLQLLCERGHFGCLPECLSEYCRRYDEANNIENVTVVSALPLTRDQKDALGRKLSQKLQRNVRLSAKVDPAVIGGLRIETEGMSMDGTVQRQLESIRETLLHTVL